jgi:propionyl-CoA carboxylase alpha chain
MEISRLLIANRGEIAVRIARTAHRLGISTVGVYSEPDANALHVDSVDVAIALGGSTPAESYLRGDAIIEAALAAGADAIHPGYGFLAENAGFAQAVIDAGLVWVGPTPEQVTLLGDKVAAKRAALEAGVPTTSMIDVVDGRVVDDAEVIYPALVKAAAGGGGRGMRVVRSADELDDAVTAASREALAAFGDGAVFIEPYLERGRHVEVQVFGDRHGNVVHLGERECSIQRRNQKIVEESPSAGISDEVRTTLCHGAVALARHVGYEGAGTIEFMVGTDRDGDATITFLEVNTRLQVEHPVTEAVTGLDLVELQLRVAAGEALPITQDDVTIDGHAIEVRVVAEDPAAGWMPSTGRIGRFSIGEGIRVDTGVRDGAEISSDYDSLVAKVIAHAPTRVEAARRLARTLRGSQITGIRTNVDSLVAILGERDYLAADTPTAYLDEHPEVLAPLGPAGDDRVALLIGAVFALEAERRSADRATPFAPSGWRNLRTQGQRQVWIEPTGEHLHVEYVMRPDRLADGSTRWSASVWLGPWPQPDDTGALGVDERTERHVRLLDRHADGVAIEVDGRRCSVRTEIVHHPLGLDADGVGAVTVHTRSTAGALTLTRAPRFVLHDAQAEGAGPICPLPGTVIAVHVAAGDAVTDGQVLMVVEAMKMEHKILAAGDATVSEVRFAVGDRVDQGDLLVALDHGDHGEAT